MDYYVNFSCKNKTISSFVGEMLAKYKSFSEKEEHITVQNDNWRIFYIRELIKKCTEKSEKPEIRTMFEETGTLVSEIKDMDGTEISFIKCEYYELLFGNLVNNLNCHIRSKFDKKTNVLVVDFAKASVKSLKKTIEKLCIMKESNVEIVVLSYVDFLNSLLKIMCSLSDAKVECCYGTLCGDESGDRLMIQQDGLIEIHCSCGMDSDDAYALARENSDDEEEYEMYLAEYMNMYVSEEGCIYGIDQALNYLISKMDRMYKWTGRISEATALNAEEARTLDYLSSMLEMEAESNFYSRKGEFE